MFPQRFGVLFKIGEFRGSKSFLECRRCLMRWFKNNKGVSYESVTDGLKEVYRSKLLPLEEQYMFHRFHSSKMTDQDFDAKPMIMFIGQYSTGKTTLIRYLLERDFPGLRIGPEPTTDKFIVLMHGARDRIIPGNALVSDPRKPFVPLDKFGAHFLNRFQCSLVNSPVLESISLVDTPGILSGEKQRVDRGYDFAGVLEWFAQRVDRIILLFDANKLDISDEFRWSIEALKGNDEKVRIILNKSDTIDSQSLMRVYGALMWSLGKVLNTPEVARVYIGSFWDRPMVYDNNRRLFQDEEQDLFRDIQSLPHDSLLRKLSDMSKRARLAMVHAYIIGTLFEKMPTFFNKPSMKDVLINALENIYEEIQNKYSIPPGDFPDVFKMKEQLKATNFDCLSSLNLRMIAAVKEMLSVDVPTLMELIPSEEASSPITDIRGGVFMETNDSMTPFGHNLGEGIDAGRGEPEWVVDRFRSRFDDLFLSLGPINGKLLRTVAKEELTKSKLPDSVLVKIWSMADVDCDGLLDKDEFALAMYLIDLKLNGHLLPNSLPQHLIPPSKRSQPETKQEEQPSFTVT